jgi:hypothetical protein
MELCAEPVAQPCREIGVKYVSSHCFVAAKADATCSTEYLSEYH